MRLSTIRRAAQCRKVARRRKEELKEFERKLLYVPAIFFVIRAWGNWRTVMDLSATSSASMGAEANPSWMELLQAVFDPSQGFFNGLLFVLLSAKSRRSVFAWAKTCVSSPTACKRGAGQCADTLCCCVRRSLQGCCCSVLSAPGPRTQSSAPTRAAHAAASPE